MVEKNAKKSKIKCTCKKCYGTGISYINKYGLGIICDTCDGKGYSTIELEPNMSFEKIDKDHGIILIEGPVSKIQRVNLFNRREKMYEVKYVMFDTNDQYSKDELVPRDGVANFVRYKEFIEGKFPIPMRRYICPQEFLLLYGKKAFEVCPSKSFTECELFGSNECWELFYNGAQTTTEKRSVLRRELK